MGRSLLEEFLLWEMDAELRSEVLEVAAGLGTGRRYLTCNTHNILIDGESQLVTIEDELDVSRCQTLPLIDFVRRLHEWKPQNK